MNMFSEQERFVEESARMKITLYFSGITPRADKMIRRLKDYCKSLKSPRYEIKIVDISSRPGLEKGEKIGPVADLSCSVAETVADILKEMSEESIFLIGMDISENKNEPAPVTSILDEEKYRHLIDTAMDAIYLINEEGVIIEVNKSAERMTGRGREELTGLSVDCVDVNFSREDFLNSWGNVPVNYHHMFETVHINKKGETFPVEVSAQKFEWGGKVYFYGIVRDITERKKITGMITESEEKYRLLFDNADVLVSLYNRNGRCLLMNKKTAAFFNGRPDVFIGKTFFDLHSEFAEEYTERIRNVIDTGNNSVFEERVVFPKGVRYLYSNVHPIRNAEGQIYAAQIISHDITEKKEAEEALKRNEALLRKIAENFPNSYLSVIEKDFTISYSSGQEFRNRNLNPEDYCGLSIEKVFGEKSDIVIEHYKNTFCGEESEFELIIDDQHQLYKTVPLSDEDGNINRILAVVENITERKNAESALQKSEERYRTLFNNINEGFALHEILLDENGNPVDFVFLEVNRAYENLTGLLAKEVIGRKGTEVIPLLEKKWIDRYGKIALTGEPMHIIDHSEYLDKYWDVKAFSPAKYQFAVTLFDITEQKKTEQNLIKSETRFRELVDTINSGVAIYKVLNDGKTGNDYVIQDFNKAALDQDGVEKEAVIGKKIADIRPNIDEFGLIDIFREVWKTGKPAFYPAKMYIDDKYSNYFENRVFRLPSNEIVAVFDDVTERKRAELLLAESEEKFRKLADSALVMISIVADAEGEGYSYTNKQWQQILGYSEEESKKIKPIDIVHPDMREVVLTNAARRINGIVPEHRYELKVITKSGETRILDFSAVAILFGNKNAILTTSIDITDRKNTERELKKHKENLELMVKERTGELLSANKELEAFAYSVSHDLRAPVRAILGFTEMLFNDYAGDMEPEAKRLASVILKNTQKMGKLIDDLLTFSRASRMAMHKTKIDMEKLVQSTYNEIAGHNKELTIEFSLSPLPSILGDINMIRQVWFNLLSNAVKFSSGKEKIIIKISATEDEKYVIYSIKDNGAGFDMKYAGKLFGVFQRLHSEREFPGTGVGLALVSRIITRHGGSVWGKGSPGNGAEFHFSLPFEKNGET